MYLTRIYLNPHRRGAKQLMRSRQMLHAAVLNCFPPGVLDDPGAPRVLWRLDCPPAVRGAAPRQGSPSCALYISSPVAPDPSHIVEEAGYATRRCARAASSATSPSSTRIPPSLLNERGQPSAP